MTLARPRGRGRWVLLALALYAVVLLGSPILHHDLACHLKSATHCNACTASPFASRIESGVPLDGWRPHRAGRVEGVSQKAPEPASAPRTTGRSPPA